MEAESAALQAWYREHARGFIENVQPEKVPDLDKDAEILESIRKLSAESLPVCFLGSAGVGKSTLINALVAEEEIVLPSGGIGPLTAQALTVQYGSQRRFEVEYHPRELVWRLVFALNQILGSERRREGATVPELKDPDILEGVDQEEFDSGESDTKTVDEYRKQAKLLVTGDQDGPVDLPYLIDSLRFALGKDRIFGTEPRKEDEDRVEHLRGLLVKGKHTRSFDSGAEGFRNALKDHASGFLAPLIAELRLFWDSPFLGEGVCLVDLPGVGISNDVHQKVAAKWIKDKAKAIVLVVESRGISVENADLLRTSGFLNRLLYGAYEPNADPVMLSVVVVKGDIIAEDRYDQANGADDKGIREHFEDVRKESIDRIQVQLRSELQEIWSAVDEGFRKSQEGVIDNLLGSMQVHAVSAVEYRKLLRRDRRAFIERIEESGIPGLRNALASMAKKLRLDRLAKFHEQKDGFFRRLLSTIRVNHVRWKEDKRAEEEAEGLRQELQVFLEPLRKEFNNRQGGYREFLRSTIPTQIENLVREAQVISSKEIRLYLKKLRGVHWATLRAAVRRGGTYFGARHIDLPRDFALCFEGPIADIWGKRVLKEIRSRIKEHAGDCVGLVEQVVEWALEKGARIQTDLLLAQRDEIRSDARKLDEVGRDMVNELREEVKSRLVDNIQEPIRRKCQAFVRRELDKGAGVRDRILNLFDELAEDVTEAASGPAVKLLTAQFRLVEKEILSNFRQHQNPLDAAADAIVASHESKVKRSDAQRRKKILSAAEAVLAVCPVDFPTDFKIIEVQHA